MLVGLIYNKKFKVYKPFLSKHLLMLLFSVDEDKESFPVTIFFPVLSYRIHIFYDDTLYDLGKNSPIYLLVSKD